MEWMNGEDGEDGDDTLLSLSLSSRKAKRIKSTAYKNSKMS